MFVHAFVELLFCIASLNIWGCLNSCQIYKNIQNIVNKYLSVQYNKRLYMLYGTVDIKAVEGALFNINLPNKLIELNFLLISNRIISLSL